MIVIAKNPSFLRRHRRTINLSTFLAFLVTATVMLFTPPTYQATAMIRFPHGVHVAEIAEHLQAEVRLSSVPNSEPSSQPRFYARPVGNDSPEVVSLVVEAENPQGLPELADKWASSVVVTLGAKALTPTHPDTPLLPVRPNKPRNILLGTFLGFLVGLGIAGLRESSKQRGAPFPISETAEPPNLGAN